MCEHLAALDKELKFSGVKETFRGQPWSENCREWVYYECILDLEKLRSRFKLPDFVKVHTNDDPKSGTESGFVCEQCHDGIMGLHPTFSKGKIIG